MYGQELKNNKINTPTFLNSHDIDIPDVRSLIALGIELISICTDKSILHHYSSGEIEASGPHQPENITIYKESRGFIISFEFPYQVPFISYDLKDYPPYPSFIDMAVVKEESFGKRVLREEQDPASETYEHVYLDEEESFVALDKLMRKGWDAMNELKFAPASYHTKDSVEFMQYLINNDQTDPILKENCRRQLTGKWPLPSPDEK